MRMNEKLLAEFQHEMKMTRGMLERVPEAKMDWKPHEKSMKLGRLAGHIAEMAHWMHATFTKDELDFSKGDFKPLEVKTTAELLEIFDKNLAESNDAIKNTTDEKMDKTWRLRNGEHIFLEMPSIAVARVMVMNHIIHHRGQLSVYLRLLDVPLPAIYGPSADEQFPTM